MGAGTDGRGGANWYEGEMWAPRPGTRSRVREVLAALGQQKQADVQGPRSWHLHVCCENQKSAFVLGNLDTQGKLVRMLNSRKAGPRLGVHVQTHVLVVTGTVVQSIRLHTHVWAPAVLHDCAGHDEVLGGAVWTPHTQSNGKDEPSIKSKIPCLMKCYGNKFMEPKES